MSKTMSLASAPVLDALPPASVRRPRSARAGRTPSLANDFYELTKPRMNFLVLVTTMVGYYMAAGGEGRISWPRLLATAIGTALCAACAGVLNQVAERQYDKLMPRTRHRPLPAGRVDPATAAGYGAGLGLVGVLVLSILVNPLTAVLGAITIAGYLWIYTPLKRHSTLNTVVGAIPGAIPPVMGWTAVRNGIGVEAAVLFCILFVWQMPHFLAIAILYRDDYAAGGFRMLPVVDEDLSATSRQILMYGVALIPVTLMPTLVGLTGSVYFIAAMLLGLGFLAAGVSAAATRTRADARRLFFASIIYLPLLLTVMMLDKA